MRKDVSLVLIPFVYFIQGAASISAVAATFFYKEDLQLSAAQVAVIGSLSILPWSIKPLYGFLSDRTPIFGYHRKPYLVAAGVLSCLGYASLSLFTTTYKQALVAIIIYNIGFALADVIVDGLVAEKSRTQKDAGKLQSLCRAALMTGALLVAYLSGVLVESMGARNVFLLSAFLPLFTCTFAIFLPEEQSKARGFSLKETWQKIRKAINKDILWAALFLFIWRATPSSGGSLNYYVIDELGFDAEFFGRLIVISRVMSIVGILIFRKVLINMPFKKLLVGIVFASVILSLPSLGLVYGWYKYIGISPQLFAIADEVVSAPLVEIGMIPLLVLVARVCPKGVEATMFAILASVMNIGLAVSDMGGAFFVKLFAVNQAIGDMPANYEHIDKVLWIAILSSLLPLPFIRFLPDIRASSELPNKVSPSSEVEGSEVLHDGKADIV